MPLTPLAMARAIGRGLLSFAGLAAAIVPASAIDLHMDAIQFRKFTTQPAQPVELHMAWRRDNDNPALQPMLNLCGEFASA